MGRTGRCGRGGGLRSTRPLPSSLTPPPGVSGPLSAITQKLLGNYFGGGGTQGQFVRSAAAVDVLGQWGFAYDPNLKGASHRFEDDAGRVRFLRADPNPGEKTSQGFRYVKYDQWSRVVELGVLVNVAKGSLAEYAAWAREADLDAQLTGATVCAVLAISYDGDPVTGTLAAYDERRGRIASRRYYPTPLGDQPTSCPGRGAGDPMNASLYAYDDLSRTRLVSEQRRDAQGVAVYRTTGYAWPEGGAVAAVDYPDEDRVQAFRTSEQGTITAWPDVLGRSVRLREQLRCRSGCWRQSLAGRRCCRSPPYN
jgi:hypothetical protein